MTMSNRKCRVRVPSTLFDAAQSCLDHAMRTKNFSIKRVADLMVMTPSALYKKIGEDRITTGELAAFEHACGATYITEYLCAQAHLFAVGMPNGRHLKAADVIDLQQHFAAAMTLLIGAYKGDADRDETVSALTTLINEICWHRANVERAECPELELFGSEK